jgi:serine/threonine protein kinase
VARIVIESGPSRGKVIELPREGSVDAGRDSGCPVHIPDGRVSRQHFAIKPANGGWFVEDAGSRNGTYVNGKRISRHTLHGGDLIRVGETFITFSTEPLDHLVGKTVAGYRIERRIGRGGMGTVYRAVQLSLERPVAFKVLSPSLQEDREFVERFLAEARSAGKLNHPNVVQVFNAGEEENVFFLSMEYMTGGSLQELLDRDGALPAQRALSMILDAANALVWAEEAGIVHRDIKPDNLLLTESGAVKVADFGLAADARKSKTLYAGGKVLGTPGYMAPEQALGKQVDHRADIYALGSTLYAALAGSAPYQGDTPVEVLLRKLKHPPKPLAEAAPRTPASAIAVVKRMMAREPEDRYPTAVDTRDAVAEALDSARTGGDGRGGFASRVGGAIRSTIGRLAPRRRGR